ncbi:centrosomal protein of 295 kDa isoform X3 [Oryzias melastigma]|uniref:centrosomal protein of 295 kDa isoform X3 n=1 Tax=Oryzias melastigma TaxID=30732 RepID=UPI00168D7B8C|nr:centrosomal protein of 295 kDa isoform X3 [Oryzias melastigma]
MKRKASKLRLSPNEEARIIREEHERRRKLRLLQVREQQRCIALQIRREVEHRRQQELQQLEEELKKQWEQQQEEKLHTLQRLYQESLQLLGHGHRSAKENEPDLAALVQREKENHTKAEERFRDALRELKTQRLKHQEKQNQSINARKKALQAEKERSTKVASLPPPPPNPIQNLDAKKLHVVKRSDAGAFASTRYHMTESAVDREAESTQPDAREEAELEARRLLHLEQEERRKRAEQMEKARLRGKQALKREQLVQDRERLLTELEHMQQTDLLRRRQQVSQMPPQIFQPLYKRQEVREDLQREMEFAFEDMYTGERRVKGDLVVQLVPEPLPDLSSCSQDQELDVTVEENRQSDAEEGSEGAEPETSAEAPLSRPAPRQALRKLLDRIRSQRSEWMNHSSLPSADGSPAASRDLIPEQDCSIETGSLPSDEKNKPVLMDRHKTVLPPTEEKTTEPPKVFTSTVQDTEEERQKKEEQLEQEKQQQMFLLQELEDQKLRLEQMLREAQQEREHLKAAVTRQQPACSISTGLPAEGFCVQLAPPAGEDDQIRRVRDYQQQLLDQNRVHQRSVEEARQRLEEYQRALRIRHSLTCRSILSTVGPPGPDPPLLHPPSTRPDPLPAPPHLPVPPAAPTFVPQRPNISTSFPTPSLTRPGSCLSSKLLLDPSGTDFVSQITDGVMERVTDHLPERLRLLPHKPPPSRPTDPTRTLNPAFTDHSPSDSRFHPVTPSQEVRQEAERQVEEHREVTRLQEERQRQEEELEQMRRQKEALQALIDTDKQVGGVTAAISVRFQDQPSSCGTSEEEEPEHLHQRRLRLLSSLLKAIEESNGGSLSHLVEEEESRSPSPSGLLHPPRALKPPVTRVWPGLREAMTEQHELSAIQEVETPVNSSQLAGPETEPRPPSPSGVWSLQSPESSALSRRTLQTPSELGLDRSGLLVWRERLLSGIGSAPGSSDSGDGFSGSGIKAKLSPSSDSGRGADFSGPALTSYRSSESPVQRPPESDCFSTSISTGSFVTSDPDRIGASADTSPSSTRWSEGTGGAERSLRSVFNDDSIQRIIDRYSRELDASLSSAGKTDVEGSYVDSGSSVSPPSLVEVSHRNVEDGGSSGHGPDPERTSEDQNGGPENDALSTPSRNDPTVSEDSFQPLIGQLADQSSCLSPDQKNFVPVGQPSAHSSLIGHLLRPPPSVSFSQEEFSSSRRLSDGPDVHADRLNAPGASDETVLWESGMRPLLGEPDESVLQNAGSSAGTVPAGSSRPSDSLLRPPAASSHEDLPQQNQNSLRCEDSFHPLLAEVTHNETMDPSLTFHLPQQSPPDSSEGFPDAVSSPSGSEPTPERLRSEEPKSSRTSSTSFTHLCSSHSLPHHSDLTLPPPAWIEVEQSAATLSRLTMKDETQDQESGTEMKSSSPAEDLLLEEEKGILEQSQITLVSLTETTVTEEEEEMFESVSFPEETPEEECETRSGSGRAHSLQDAFLQKRGALLLRSKRRVDELKAKAAQAKRAGEAPPTGNEASAATAPPSVCSEDAAPQLQWRRPPPADRVLEVKMSTPEQRKRNLSEMHRRTRRLYEQLEEVKQQRSFRSRQEDYAKNRLKAREFHMKTLQKLRAKQR